MHTYDLAETAALIDAARGTRMLVPAMLAVLCGLRRGEMVALRWRSVDIERGQLAVVESVEQTGAECASRRPRAAEPAPWPCRRPWSRNCAHRARQAQELLRLGVRLSPDTLVVARADGEPMQPRSLTHEWEKLAKRRGLRRIRFHDLATPTQLTCWRAASIRRSPASGSGTKVGITLDLYSHVTRGMQDDAATLVDAALQAAIKKRAEGIG